MKEYLVTWEIDIDAETPVEAAQKALAIHRNEESEATVFHVKNKESGAVVHVDADEWKYPER